MSVSADYIAYLTELFAPLGRIRSKRMFGGAGLYCDELFFAIVIDDVLYLKVDEHNRAQFEAEGLEPFRYEAKGKLAQMNYYRAPDEALDSPALMHPWARSALAAALRAKK
ncbi:TfoX/Sxy family protein [Uliginosibacterium flavum]|uniref:TfoX/Sxy family protein n=1 Tax=Uliginosibacterium flavum TaxID=1396831 RepID=A0ABV2TH35_9RHOO